MQKLADDLQGKQKAAEEKDYKVKNSYSVVCSIFSYSTTSVALCWIFCFEQSGMLIGVQKVNGLLEEITTTTENSPLFNLSGVLHPTSLRFTIHSLGGLVARAGNTLPVHTLHTLVHHPHPPYSAGLVLVL